MRFPDHLLQEIRERTSIVEVAGRHVALRRSGKNWKGLCPFHDERTPSFVVNDERGVYHCFGCGAGGDVFRLVMELEGLTFPEAVERLARDAGVALPRPGGGAGGRTDERALLLDLLELAARYYRHHLVEGRAGERARAYLAHREVPAHTAERFRLGCAPAGWDPLVRYLRRKGIPLERAEQAGLVVRRAGGGYYDRFRDRLMFPIADHAGRVVGFGGRVLGEGEPKYLNGPETPVFQKRRLLYGLHQAAEALRRTRRALLVEGYMDVVSLHARGEAGAVATLGTALGPEHVRTLRRRAERIVLVYDGDEAGRRAAFRSLDVFLAEGVEARAVFLPAGHDPDSFVRGGGDLGALVEGAPTLFGAWVEALPARFDLSTAEGRVAAVREVAVRLSRVADPVARDHYAARAAEVLGVDEAHIRARMGRSRPGGPERAETGPEPPPLERELVAALVRSPAARRRFLEQGAEAWMEDPLLRRAARFVAGRGEDAVDLEGADEEVRSLLARLLVDGEPGAADYEALASRLRRRVLRRRKEALIREIRRAEQTGDLQRVIELQREKAALDREAAGLGVS